MSLVSTLLTSTLLLLCSFTLGLGFDRIRPRVSRPRPNTYFEIDVPNAQCLFGKEWKYVIRPGDPEHLAIIFRPGAFCDSVETCIPDDTTEIPPFESYTLGKNPLIEEDPLTSRQDRLQWTVLVLPSCNKDANLGNNVVPLDSDGTSIANFVGGVNLKQVFDDILTKDKSLVVNKYIDFDQVKHLVLWGTSSGSITAAVWAFQILEYVRGETLKTMILDGWAFDSDTTSAILGSGVALTGFLNSPAFVPDLAPVVQSNSFNLETLVGKLQDQYCELFVSSVFFEYDVFITSVYATIFNSLEFLDANVWRSVMLDRIIPDVETYDPKRSSFYVADGNNHVLMFPSIPTDRTLVSTECEEDLTAQEYLTRVIGGRKVVDEYFGKPQFRVKKFPLGSWNDLLNTANSTTCLLC